MTNELPRICVVRQPPWLRIIGGTSALFASRSLDVHHGS
jgi:hypothetical protein